MAFDKSKADRAINFIEQLKHTKGQFFGQPFILLPWQKEFITNIFGTVNDYDPTTRQYRQAYMSIPKKQGKQLALTTPIPTPYGWTKMGDLCKGDLVLDDAGNTCHVVGLSEIDDTEQCYRITFRDGSYIDAGARHIWDAEWIYGKSHLTEITSEEIYNAYQCLKLEGRSPIRIRVADALKLSERELPIDPYTYGYWLGNGNATKPEITVRTEDVDNIKRNIPYSVHNEYPQQCGGSSIIVYSELKSVLVHSFRDKVIRSEYLRASECQRWSLLQGLMDSDGSINRIKGQSIYVSTIKQLSDSVRELLWSLGIKNSVKEQPSTRYGIPTGETLYIIRFTSYDDMPVSKLERKLSNRVCRKHNTTRSDYHYIMSIEPLKEKVPMRCIQVDSPSHLYLAGTSFVPTHNSELGAALALYMLCADGEQRAEVYSAAADRAQASLVYDVACDMVRLNPALSKRLKIVPSTKTITYPATGSVYRVLSSDVRTKHGLNVSAVIFDELHTQPNRELFDVLTSGSGDARRQPLFIFLTTAGVDRNSICYEVHQKALDILSGKKKDPRFYPVVYSLPLDADWKDEKNWYIANPSLGYTISIEAVRDGYRKALESASEELNFRQLRLNQWVTSSTAWIQSTKWDACKGELDYFELAESLKGRECYCGLDLSSTSDLTAFVMVFPPPTEDGAYCVLTHAWIPYDNMQLRTRRDHVLYTDWHGAGFIHSTEGNVIDHQEIRRCINELHESYNIKEIAVDRWNATSLIQELTDDGFMMIPFGQGMTSMSSPTKELERLALSGKLIHGGHPVLSWCIQNVELERDAADSIKMSKAKSTEKIDCAVALVMGLDRAMRHTETESVYDREERGLLFL